MAAFGIGLFGTAAVIRPWLPFPPIPGIRDKIQWFAENGDRFDTLFIGSSRIYRQIIPKLFDKTMAEAGMPTHSFNLGMDGMSPPEDSYVMEQILAHRTKPLKYVVAECDRIRISYYEQGLDGTIRHAYWHDSRRFGLVARSLLGPSVGGHLKTLKRFSKYRVKTLMAFGSHVQLFLANSVNLGRGKDWLTPPPVSNLFLGDKEDGYVPADRAITASETDDLRVQISRRLREDIVMDFGDMASQELLLDKSRLSQAHQARMVLLLPPSSGDNFYPAPAVEASAPLIDLSDPRSFPELYQPTNRRDSVHLNSRGAELFTRLIARKLIELNAGLSGGTQASQ